MDILEDSVVIGYVHPNIVTEGFARDLAKACLWQDNKIVGIISASSPRQFVARNSVIEKFLEGPAEWLMWIDTDMTFEPAAIDQLRKTAAAHSADMVGGLAFIFKRHDNQVIPNGYNWDDEIKYWVEITDYVSGHTYEIGGTGAAFVLINRRVFEAWDEPKWHQDWFESPANGDAMGHDLAFFWRATQVDEFKLVWDTSIKSGHIKHFELDEDAFRSYQEMNT